MQVKFVERNVFLVEGDTLICPSCSKIFARNPGAPPWFSDRQKVFLSSLGLLGKVEGAIGMLSTTKTAPTHCTNCKDKLEVRWHRCDITANEGKGGCSCEWFEFAKGKKVDPDFTCKHLQEAKAYALSLAIQQEVINEREEVF